mmetsp:Transcript_3358/g.5804  ORF Transcript_3358/g.5804 Transcript_3358/m.5804 type:complete len:216 (-) Transcript_3358:279-926(-)
MYRALSKLERPSPRQTIAMVLISNLSTCILPQHQALEKRPPSFFFDLAHFHTIKSIPELAGLGGISFFVAGGARIWNGQGRPIRLVENPRCSLVECIDVDEGKTFGAFSREGVDDTKVWLGGLETLQVTTRHIEVDRNPIHCIGGRTAFALFPHLREGEGDRLAVTRKNLKRQLFRRGRGIALICAELPNIFKSTYSARGHLRIFGRINSFSCCL